MFSLISIVYLSSFFLLIAVYGMGYSRIFTRGWNVVPLDLPKTMSLQRIDVVIPIRDESDLLRGRLLNMYSQTYPHELLNIIVVDSSQSDAIQRVIEQISQEHRGLAIKLIKDNSGMGKSHSLNLAFRECSNEFVIITDVDVLVEPDGIEKLIQNFQDHNVGGVSAMEIDATQFGDLRAYRNLYNILRLAESQLDSVVMCESNFSAYRRELIEELPGDTQCDDLALTTSVISKNHRAVYDPRVVFYENRRNLTRSQILAQKLRRARANIHALLKTAASQKRSQFSSKFRKTILPFEVSIHVIAPILFSVWFVSLIMFAITSGDLLLTAVACFLPLGIAIAFGSLVSMRLSPGRSVTDYLKMDLEIVYAFVEYNIILLTALVLLILRGPQTRW